VSDTALSQRSGSRVEGAAVALRAKLRVDAGEAATAARIVVAAVGAYAVLFIFAAVVHYLAFQSGRADLGNMVQAIWNTQHGRFLEMTTPSGHQHDRLGFHVDPFLLLFVPLFWIWSSPLLLLAVQVLAVASGALPVFWLARKHLGSSRAGAHFALAYLLYPATQYNAFTPSDGFHSVSFAIPLVLYAIWFLDEDRLLAFSAVGLLACTTKEEIPLAVGCLGIWYAVRKGHRLFGLSVFAAGLAVTLFNFLWVIPHFSPTGADPFVGRYRAVGGTPKGIAHKLVTDPIAFVHAVSTGHKAFYVALLLVPFLGLCLLEPLLLLGAVPDLAINLLSNVGVQTSPAFQYTAGIVPFVVAASIFGAARFKPAQSLGVSQWVLVGAALVAIVSPLYALQSDVSALGSSRLSAKAHALSLVPRGVPVSASVQLAGYLSERRDINTFPHAVHARWIVVDINDPAYRGTAGLKRKLRKYETDRAWRIVFSSHGVTVLHKRPVQSSVLGK
jgi:uncharacterized membrane protein